MISLTKLLSYPYVQVPGGLTLGYLLIHGVNVKPNFNSVMVENARAYSLFFIYMYAVQINFLAIPTV